jgi:hypothetical protein
MVKKIVAGIQIEIVTYHFWDAINAVKIIKIIRIKSLISKFKCNKKISKSDQNLSENGITPWIKISAKLFNSFVEITISLNLFDKIFGVFLP